MLFASVFTTAALLIAHTAAHGSVTSYVIDGATYPGYIIPPFPAPTSSSPTAPTNPQESNATLTPTTQLRRLLTRHLPQNHPTPMARLQPHPPHHRQKGPLQRRHFRPLIRQSRRRRQNKSNLEAVDPRARPRHGMAVQVREQRLRRLRRQRQEVVQD